LAAQARGEISVPAVVLTPADCFRDSALNATRKIVERWAVGRPPRVALAEQSRAFNPFPAEWRRTSIAVNVRAARTRRAPPRAPSPRRLRACSAPLRLPACCRAQLLPQLNRQPLESASPAGAAPSRQTAPGACGADAASTHDCASDAVREATSDAAVH